MTYTMTYNAFSLSTPTPANPNPNPNPLFSAHICPPFVTITPLP